MSEPSRMNRPEMLSRIVDVHGLTYRYADGTQALNGLEFSMAPGECVALFGANGSGKTTFVLHLNGLYLAPSSSSSYVRVCGVKLDTSTSAADLANVRARVGMVFQDSDEQLFLPTVLEDVAFGPVNLGMPQTKAVERARAALELVGMAAAASKAPYHLSSGEKRRVALAGVLAMEPELLVLDEPTTSLDPPGQRTLTHLLGSLRQARIIVTHDTEFAAALADRAVFFDNGRIIGEGTVEEVVTRFHWSRRSE